MKIYSVSSSICNLRNSESKKKNYSDMNNCESISFKIKYIRPWKDDRPLLTRIGSGIKNTFIEAKDALVDIKDAVVDLAISDKKPKSEHDEEFERWWDNIMH